MARMPKMMIATTDNTIKTPLKNVTKMSAIQYKQACANNNK
eukprot:CAMPEP_0197081228 /NCGR_PEP_ID=MMETSP1384-20130603/214531_1 /TAXON_ID=29189 /ORGANISM="Ammonia sp." /LENGTH=40 /DNA_ID= /DNA_START= /DNA_END= /DNA_ORIENTATION=